MIDPVTASIAALTYLTKGIAKPVADELGNMAGDKMRVWRANNLHKILEKANGKLALGVDGNVCLNPKVVVKIAEEGSLESDAELQDMWAGLLASSRENDNSLLYVDILSGLTKGQAAIIEHLCSQAEVLLTVDTGLLYVVNGTTLRTEDVLAVFGNENIHELDQALDDLHRKGLIDGAFNIDTISRLTILRLAPKALALHFFARVNGSADSVEFYKKRGLVKEEVLDSIEIPKETERTEANTSVKVE